VPANAVRNVFADADVQTKRFIGKRDNGMWLENSGNWLGRDLNRRSRGAGL
jgi:hypothetical protein